MYGLDKGIERVASRTKFCIKQGSVLLVCGCSYWYEGNEKY